MCFNVLAKSLKPTPSTRLMALRRCALDEERKPMPGGDNRHERKWRPNASACFKHAGRTLPTRRKGLVSEVPLPHPVCQFIFDQPVQRNPTLKITMMLFYPVVHAYRAYNPKTRHAKHTQCAQKSPWPTAMT